MSHREEAPGQIPDMLERLYLSVDRESEVWDSQLKVPPRPGPDKQKKMDWWMDKITIYTGK